MESIQFILAVFGLVVVWRVIWCRSLLDQTRDNLFDVRDELRAKFVLMGWDLGSDAYKRARDLINAHLRFTEELSFWHIVYMQAGVATDAQLTKAVKARFESLFADLPKEQVEFVQLIRGRSLHSVMEFAVANSFVLFILKLALTPFVFLERLASAASRGTRVFVHVTVCSAAHLGKTASSLSSRSADIVAGWVMTPAVVEHYSVKHASC